MEAPTTPQERHNYVASIFEEHFGPLYVDVDHTEWLWSSVEPSVDIVLDAPEGERETVLAADTAFRVACMIALGAYGPEILANVGLSSS